MVLLNQNQLLGALVPDVYISKIILETVGGAQILREENPHIDLSKSPEKQIDPLTGKLVKPRLGASLFDKNAGTAEKLSVTVELILKEKLDNGLIGTWFKNEDFSKYLKLKVIQSTKPALTQAATNNKNLLLVMSKDSVVPISKRGLINGLSSVARSLQIFDSKSLSNVRDAMDRSIQSRTLSVKDDIVGDKTNLTQHYSEVDSDGNTITSFVFRVCFEFTNQNPEHLSYFAFSYLDLFQLAKDFKLKLDSRLISEPFGKVVSDIVFENGEIIGQSFVYLDETGALWVGPIDETSTNGSFGITKDGTKIPITRTVVGNSKIQDFRDFKDIDRLVLDFSIVENEILNTKLVGPRRDALDIQAIESTFSDFQTARDEEGRARFFFSVNFRKLLSLNGIYGKLFSNPKTGPLAMLDSFILSMKIVRRRIKGSPEIGSVADASQLFESNQIDDVISISGERFYKGFFEKNTQISSIREIKDVFVQGIEGPQNLSDIRHFTGVDKSISDITDGYYVYGIEMEIVDPSYDFLRSKLGELHGARNELLKYFHNATKLESSKTLISNNNPHIDFPGEIKVDQTTTTPGNFNTILNRFTQKFINEQIAKYGTTDIAVTPWGTAVKVYIDMMKLFAQNSDSIPFDKFEKSLFYFVHPATGNPSGILKLLNLMDTLETSLSKAVGDSGTSSVPSTTSGKPLSKLGMIQNVAPRMTKVMKKGKTSVKSFNVVKFFNNTPFNASVPKSIGYDFLDASDIQDQLNGLRVITGGQYAARVERENNHYFISSNDTKPDINIKFRDQQYTFGDSIDNTSFSYLTPAKIKFAEKFNVMRLGNSPTPIVDRAQMAHLDLSIKSFNTNLTPTRDKSYNSSKNTSNKATYEVSDDAFKMLAKLNVEPILEINKNRIPLVNIIQGRNSVRDSKIIDPIIDIHSNCDTNNKGDAPKVSVNLNPTPVLLDLIKKLDTHQISKTSSQTKGLSFSSNSKTIGGKPASVRMFDVASEDSLINKVIQDKKLSSAESFFQGKPHNTTFNFAMSSLPNQVKSLYLSRTSPTIVRKNVFSHPTDPLKTPELKTEFRLDYQMINTIQVFNGYQKSSDGELLLKNPIWMPLTLFAYNQATGGVMLCRMKSYENKVIGIVRDKSLDLPVYDEYFLLTPQVDAVGVELPKIIPTPVLTISPRIATPRIEVVGLPKSASLLENNLKISQNFQKEVKIFTDVRVQSFATQMESVDNLIKEGGVNKITITIASNPSLSQAIPGGINMATENRNQMAVRTEYMSNNIVNNTTNVNSDTTKRGSSTISAGNSQSSLRRG